MGPRSEVPKNFKRLAWQQPFPYGQFEFVKGFGGVVAPLLAGFSLTTITLLLTTTTQNRPRYTEWAIVAFALSTVFLLLGIEYSMRVSRHGALPSDRLDWFPEATVARKYLNWQRELQAEDYLLMLWHARVADILRGLGPLLFLVGLALLLVPTEWTSPEIVGFAVVVASGLLQVALLASEVFRKSIPLLMKDREDVHSEALASIDEVDDLSWTAVRSEAPGPNESSFRDRPDSDHQ
jgi:hypothetical protein